MRIAVKMSGMSYGGYDQDAGYTVRIDYDDFSWTAGDEIDFEKHKDIAKQIEKVLLGKRVASNIKNRWTKEVIVYKGETIAKLHVQKILENWDCVEFGKTSMADKIKKLRRECTRRVLKTKIREKSGGAIEIDFTYEGGYPQHGGSIVIPPSVARWIGKRLMEASTGDLRQNGCVLVVNEKGELTEKK